jgi:hypothetical protein
MMFYRVTRTRADGENEGYDWHTTKRDAERASYEYRATQGWDETGPRRATIERVSITPTKTGILLALTNYASHNNNG